MSDIRKLIDTINEMATTSGSVAAVAQPMGGVKSRKKDSIFYEGEKCTSCGCDPCKCDSSEGNAVDGTKTPQSPNVSEFGLWKNSALIGQEQREKKKKKSVKESRKAVPYEGDREYNALDDVQDQIAKMAHRHKDEKWTMDDYKRLGKKLAQQSSKSKLDELGNSLMPGGQRSLHLAQETFVDPRNSRRHPGAVDEDSGKQVDMTGKKCTACKKGTYEETSQHDDMDGVLHCTKCRKEVKRHQTVKPAKKNVSEGFMDELKDVFWDALIKRAKQKIPAEHHKDYDFDSMRSMDGTNKLTAQARAAGHLKRKGIMDVDEGRAATATDAIAKSKDKMVERLKAAMEESDSMPSLGYRSKTYKLYELAKEKFGQQWADKAYTYAQLHLDMLNSPSEEEELEIRNQDMRDIANQLGYKHDDYMNEGLGKSIKRAAQGWGSPQDKPADIVKRNKGYDIDTAKKVRAGIDGASDHSPQGLQKRVLDRKLKGVDEGVDKEARAILRDRIVADVLNFYSMHDRIPSIKEFSRPVRAKLNALEFDERSTVFRQAVVQALKLLGKQGKSAALTLDEHGDPWEDPNYDPRGGGETRSPEQIEKDNAEHAILSKKLGLKNTNKLPDIKDDMLKMMNHFMYDERKKKK